MYLEQKIDTLMVMIGNLSSQMAGQAPPTASATVAQAAIVSPTFGAPPALANGMPGGPFGAQPAAVVPPVVAAFTPQVAGAPFGDLVGCTKYAVDAHAAMEAKGPGRGEIITQLIQHLCGSGSINDLPTTAYPAFYTEMEKQKAL